MTLNGWHRLWIVIIILYGMVVVLVAVQTQPKLSSLEWRWVDQASDIMAEKITEKEGNEVAGYRIREVLFKDKTNKEMISWLEDVAQSPYDNQKIFSASVSKINNKFKKKLKELPGKQRNHYLQSTLWWAIPSICLYLLGWSTGWVFRGFKQNKR